MNKSIFFFLLLLSLFSTAQTERTLYISKLGWRISIPEIYKISDTSQNPERFDREEKWKSDDISSFPDNKLFTIEKNTTCFMGAALIPYDSSKDGEWTSFVSKNNSLVFKGILNADFTMDSTSVTEVFSGLAFIRTDYSIKFQKSVIIRAISLNRQFGNHALRIYLTFTEQEDAEKYLNILRKSTFTEDSRKS
jgi:hypothetical protein